jgi:hypothetical protein
MDTPIKIVDVKIDTLIESDANGEPLSKTAPTHAGWGVLLLGNHSSTHNRRRP